MIVERGDIVLVNLEPVFGSEQGKIRPCLVVQNNILNKLSSITTVVPLTSKIPEKEYPTIVIVSSLDSELKEKSTILCTQLRAISVKDRVIKKIGKLSNESMHRVDIAIKTTLALD
ncbi:MAG: type II toxin-antitoxin system PemK/MazF family toxin [Candidatus Diapherotrites archaeon]|nr:type II toxin-antitoxin system PemK/MazF family toxin [Candidatus Diapherotrites archaeon]